MSQLFLPETEIPFYNVKHAIIVPTTKTETYDLNAIAPYTR